MGRSTKAYWKCEPLEIHTHIVISPVMYYNGMIIFIQIHTLIVLLEPCAVLLNLLDNNLKE
jgi:hypothetical protein